MRVDTFREIDPEVFYGYYNNQIEIYCRINKMSKKKSVLYGRKNAKALLGAAKKYNLDPVYFACQTFLESAYGTSTLAKGHKIGKRKYIIYMESKHMTIIRRSTDSAMQRKKAGPASARRWKERLPICPVATYTANTNRIPFLNFATRQIKVCGISMHRIRFMRKKLGKISGNERVL